VCANAYRRVVPPSSLQTTTNNNHITINHDRTGGDHNNIVVDTAPTG
jgi:hypothetical protein